MTNDLIGGGRSTPPKYLVELFSNIDLDVQVSIRYL